MKDRIKQCRVKMKYSQKYVAISIGVATPTISMWESGAKQPTIDNLAKLADLFDTSVDYLIGRTNESGEFIMKKASKLTEAENNVIQTYRHLTPQGQEYIRQQFEIAKKIYQQSDPVSVLAE